MEDTTPKSIDLEIARLARAPSEAELIRTLGAERFARLSARQRNDLWCRLYVVRTWPLYWRAAGGKRGDFAKLSSAFREGTLRASGRRLSVTTLRRWRRAYRRGGAAGLIDRRGRPRADAQPLDIELLIAFSGLIARGAAPAVAHAKMAARAAREDRAWCSLATLRGRLKTATPIELPAEPGGQDGDEYFRSRATPN